jgi:predicted phosphodiesterase
MAVPYLVVSDLHANIEAFTAVLNGVKRKKFDGVYCLGDVVDYGASPNPVAHLLAQQPNVTLIRGNHERAALGLDGFETFNPVAKTSVIWTQQKLDDKSRKFLNGASLGPLEVQPGVILCHGSPQDEDSYILSDYDALLGFEHCDFNVALFGHSHYASAFIHHGTRIQLLLPRKTPYVLKLEEGKRYLINPGSVGQPRDRNPHAAFGILDLKARTFTFRRAPYDIAGAQQRIRRAGLPEQLAARLAFGM